MKKSLLLASLHNAYLAFTEATRKPYPEELAGLREVPPPEYLYVRVPETDLHDIYQNGLDASGGRYWLWCNVTRSSRATTLPATRLLTIEAQSMHEAGHKFWLAKDGSYTTHKIPSVFIQ